jgi:hypothetical protein
MPEKVLTKHVTSAATNKCSGVQTPVSPRNSGGALKVIGRFIWLERNGKQGYAAYIPYALDQARRVLAGRKDFARLHAALGA